MQSPKAIVVICTRPDSSRILRKAFKKIAGIPAIEHILKRLGTTFRVILAVPENCRDYDNLRRYDVAIYRGNSDSPLHRMAEAVNWYRDLCALPKYVVRVTHDDILIDENTMVELVDAAEKEGAGYAISPGIIDGAGVEVIDVQNLFAAASAMLGQNVEHISYFVRGPGMPNPKQITVQPRPGITRPYRLTMDYPEDAIILETVLRQVGNTASVDDICRFLDMHAEILNYNALPAVSVYICARNAEKWIQDAIRSVPKTCSAGAVELIVVEDVSDDQTLTRIMECAGYISRLIVNEENLGLASSSNVGLKNSRARYVMRLDADDRLKPGALDIMLETIKKSHAGIVYAGYDEMNESGGVITRAGCDPREHHHAGAALMDAKLINELRFREGLRHWDGMELYNRMREANMPIAYVDAPCWFYRKHEASMSSTNQEERARVKEDILRDEVKA